MSDKPTHTVFLRATVNVKVPVNADSQVQAIRKAQEQVNLDKIHGLINGAEYYEYADEVTTALVDTLDENGEFIEDETTEYDLGGKVPIIAGVDQTSMLNWFPQIENLPGLNIPKTVFVRTDRSKLMSILDGEPSAEFDRVKAALQQAAEELGWPVFMRTSHTSHKHDWLDSCMVEGPNDIGRHLANLIEFSVTADFFGLPIDAIVLRQVLKTEPAFKAFNGMPITKEFRVRIEDGEVTRLQFYWPPSSIRDPGVEDWYPKLKALASLNTEQAKSLTDMAITVAQNVPGDWSVDFLWAEDKWWLIDMAEGNKSYWWHGYLDKDYATIKE